MESEINVKNSISWLTVQNLKVYWKQKTKNEFFNNAEKKFSVYYELKSHENIKTIQFECVIQMFLNLGYSPLVLTLKLVIIE